MTTLIRPSSHGNNVAVIYISNGNFFRKVSYKSSGRKYIDNEYSGFAWYSEIVSRKTLVKKYTHNENYSCIDIQKVEGGRADYRAGLTKNQDYIDLCIDHYLEVFPREKVVPCHGDLTLDNVIFSKNGAIFFDWEHFSLSGEAWGFDIAYLLMSSAFFPYYKQGSLPSKHIAIFRRLWGRLKENGLRGDIATQPMTYFKQVFRSKNHWKKIISNSPNKLFPMWSEDDFTAYLHNILKDC
jgi:hypothetical protein